MASNSSNKRTGDSCLLPFHGAGGLALVAGTAFIDMNPAGLAAICGRPQTEADGWAHFRMRALEFRLHHGAITGDVAAGYVGSVQDTPPANTAAVCEVLPSVYYGSTYTKPSDWVRVSKKDLAGCFPWYKTVPGTADSTEEKPGVLCISGAGTDTPVIELRGVIEFKTAVSANNTPAELKLRNELRLLRAREEQALARQGLLRVLSVGAPSATRP